MKKLFILLCFLPITVWADWQAEVSLGLEGESWKIERTKFIEAKENVLSLGKYQLKMTIKKSEQENGVDVSYSLHEKKGEKYILMNEGAETIENKGSSEIIMKEEDPKKKRPLILIKFKTT